MAFDRETTFKTLIESRNGFHLSVYIENRGLADLRRRLRTSIETAKAFLRPVLAEQDMDKFLEPLEALCRDFNALRGISGNVGIFRSEDVFRVLGLPVEVENTCVVASTFHVKPLLRWMQMDREFLILGLEKGSATLYRGNQLSFEALETIIFPEVLKLREDHGTSDSLDLHRSIRLRWEETSEWLATWITRLDLDLKSELFLAGDRRISESLLKVLRREGMPVRALSMAFSQGTASLVCAEVRYLLRKDVSRVLESSLVEYYHAEELSLAKRNIYQIAKAVVQGKVRKLIVADGINIFGKIDLRTGDLAIHPADLDHEDDCVLDDLAQTVLASGGEVVVASRDEIPKGQPILAILEGGALEAPAALPLPYEQRCL